MYGYGLWAAFSGVIAWGTTGKCKVALMKSTYSPNQDTHEKWEDISAHEIAAGDGYTAGGQAITWAGAALSYASDATPGGILSLLGDDVTWASLTKSGANAVRSAVVYYDNGTGYSEPLIGYVLWDADITLAAEAFTIAWASGVVAKIGLEGSTP
jgi:hypothetical protein